MTKYIIILLLSLFSLGVKSQGTSKSIENQDVIWYTYLNSLKFSDKIQLVTDIQERQFINPTAQHQFLVRTNFLYELEKSWEVGGGVSLFFTSRNTESAEAFIIPEIRPHVEVNQKQLLNKITLAQRYRLEMRNYQNTNATRTELENGFTFNNFRFRYQIQAVAKLFEINKHAVKMRVIDEVMVNFGKKITTNMFDQNNIYAGLQYEIYPNFAFELGFLKRFQQKQTAGSFYERDILRITLLHKINLTKKSNAN